MFNSNIKDKVLIEFSTYGKNLITEHTKNDSIYKKKWHRSLCNKEKEALNNQFFVGVQ